MEKFFALPEEKRQMVISAALECFGKYGYEKASIKDIAVAAHISKASVFQYFGSKRKLYEYLLTYCRELVVSAFDQSVLDEKSDLLERIMAASMMKTEYMKRHPFVLQFVASVWTEDSLEVADLIASMMDQSGQFRNELVLRDSDAAKFKNPEDSALVFRMLLLVGEGYSAHYHNGDEFDCDAVMEEFGRIVNMLRSNFYKEEYLV